MRFVLNDRLVDVSTDAPDRTVLELLRAELGQRGTKEGCASGDCGACTVLLSRTRLADLPAAAGPDDYQSLNACIAPAAVLAGRHLVTVEGLAVDGALHPAQRAMVEAHGSQCGFCTPGFVMSLAGLHERHADAAPPDAEAIREGISGNLCRCTGYRPILEAAARMAELPATHRLRDLLPAGATGLATGPSAPDYLQPTSEAQLQAALRDRPDATLIAGGTDLMLERTQKYTDLGPLIDVSGVRELGEVATRDGHWLVGAAAPLTALQQFFATALPPLATLLGRYGSPQIRNRGTLGGSLGTGSPIGDLAPVLQALDAVVLIGAADGSRREIAAADFHTGYRQNVLARGEYIAGARVPVPAAADRVLIRKYSKRHEDDISTVLGAACLRRDAGTLRIAFGGVAALPLRARTVERLLSETPDAIDAALAEALAADIDPIDDVRGSAAYRRALALAFVREVGAALAPAGAPA